ncbi:ribosome maturation factor RimM [Sulfurimonas sp. SWIR-19]|uniref:ribosome maturation factor RimM n=1 Tax=Sulfurimonas sp. SWIR-19 TaxID=2878390 RepID=UPI001CF23E20|nr:ribosome maturation factor RimM [Sulfurimonas sp. SWIR-19]UCM99856.1 ribosome maturation factor RimM [Sulfurimonas sp. SWIR-19]
MHIATIGKTVGIQGDMKLHLKCDFPEQFVKGATFLINKSERITLSDVDLNRGLVRINSIANPEDAKKFTNAKLFTTYEETRKNCHLEEGEYFWFDLEDCEVYEDAKCLGRVKEIERFNTTNYLSIVTDESLVESGLAKSFLVPFIEPFKVEVDIEKKRITLSGAVDILEAS